MKRLLYLTTALALIAGGYAQNFQWARATGGTDMDLSCSIITDASGNVYTTGSFNGTVDFDPGAGIFNLTSAGGQSDIFVCKLDASGNFVWAKAMGGTDDESGQSITLDAAGNIYIAGYFGLTADLDPGVGTFNLTSAGGYDIFVSKLDPSGNFVWARSMGGTGINDYPYSIGLDPSGNVHTTGRFQGTADFDPGAGTFTLVSVGITDIFVSKLDASGNFVWAKKIETTGNDDVGYSIAVDASGNVYTAGYFSGTGDFDPGAGTFSLMSSGFYDAFISKLNSSGNLVWAKSMGGPNNDVAESLTLDASGNVYTTGSFNLTADFDPGAGTFNLTSAGDYDIFISKLDPSGNFVWAKKAGGALADNSKSISLDAAGNIYVTGGFYGTADFDPGPGTFNLNSAGGTDIFISKLDGSGNFIWANSMFGGLASDWGLSIDIDASNSVYTTGTFQGTTDFDPGAGTYNLTSAGQEDIFVHKLSQPPNSILEVHDDSGFSIFPNPNNGKFKILSHDDPGKAILKITSITGQAVFEKTFMDTAVLNIELNAAPGLYFLTITKENGLTEVIKLIKE